MAHLRAIRPFMVGSEFTIMVPLADNRGVPFSDLTLAAIEEQILATAGGFTSYPVCSGAWCDNGRTYRDPVRPYAVGCKPDQALSLARFIGATLHQEAVYVRCPNGGAAIIPTAVQPARAHTLAGQSSLASALALGIVASAFTLSGHGLALLSGILALLAYALASIADHAHTLPAVATALAMPLAIKPADLPTNGNGKAVVSVEHFSEMIGRILDTVQSASPEQRVAGDLWYQVYGAMIADHGTSYGLSRFQACGIFAVLSPKSNPQENYRLFATVCANGADNANGRIYSHQRAKIRAIIASDGSLEAVARYASGPKVNAFYRNLAGDESIPTIDRHAYAVCSGRVLTDDEDPTPNEHKACSAAYRVAGAILNITPARVQAIAWIVWRANKGIEDPDVSALLSGRPADTLHKVCPTRSRAMGAVVSSALANGHRLQAWTVAPDGSARVRCMHCPTQGAVTVQAGRSTPRYLADLPATYCTRRRPA